MPAQIIINILIHFALVALVGISFLFIFNISKYYAIHHASIIALGGYFTWLFCNGFDLPLHLAIFLSILLTTIIGILIQFLIFSKFHNKRRDSFLLIIASLGVYIIIQNLISIFFGDDSKIIRTGEITAGNELLGAYITDFQITIVSVCLVLICCSLFFIQYTRIGQMMRAVSENEELSMIFGINSKKIILWSFGIGSAFAAIAGILIGFESKITPSMGFGILFYGVVAMIIGGVSNFKGLIGGALLLATAQHLGAYYIDSKWMDAIAYIILILFLIWKPLGFSGKQLKKVEI